MSKSIATNITYNLLFQIVRLLIPLITEPYISRVLGKEGIGVYSYTLSAAQCFILIGTLGISLYGSRQIAYVKDDKQKMSKTFWSIFFLQVITTGIALVFYIIILGFNKEYSYAYLIQAMNIVAAMLDITWLYMGIEDFQKTVTRNFIIKVLGVICIFSLIKSNCDLYKYITINGIIILLGNLVMWMYVPNTVWRVNVSYIDIKKHLIPALQLFIPQIAIQIYVVLDKTMLGALSNMGQVGIYDQAQKIVKLFVGLVSSLGVVMLPRMSNTFANGEHEKMDNYLNMSLCGVAYVSIPMAFGIAAMSDKFVPCFFGPGFEEVSYLINITAPTLFFIAASNVFSIQYLIPINKVKEYTVSVTIGAIINVTLNLILIPKYKAIGASIDTLAAEFSVMLMQYFFVRKNVKNKYFLLSVARYIFASIIMFGVIRIIEKYMMREIITVMAQVVTGIIVYILVLAALRDKVNSTIFKIIFSRIYKNPMQIFDNFKKRRET